MPFGIVISIICLTGALLVIEKPVTRMLYPYFYGEEVMSGSDAGSESRSMVVMQSSEKSSSIDKSLTAHRLPLLTHLRRQRNPRGSVCHFSAR